jgi:FMN phosphatase YigB (HAD superfamily)
LPLIRAVVSDLGRVVLWFDNNIFLRKLAERLGIPFEKTKEAVHENLALVHLFDSGDLRPAEFRERVLRAVGGNVGDEFFWASYNDIFWPNDHVLEVLRRVKGAGYKTILLSNTDPERFGFVRRRFPQILFFDDYALSYELRLLKPNPAIYIEAARRAGCPPTECVFIDDMEENVKGAIAAGLQGIHYLPETDLAAELRTLGLTF